MKKDYSDKNIINFFGFGLPNFIGYLLSMFLGLICILLFNLNFTISLLLLGVIHSFIGLKIGGKLLDKYCINKDIKKCKNCKYWNCCRDIKGSE